MDRRRFLSAVAGIGSVGGVARYYTKTGDESCTIVRESRIDATEIDPGEEQRASIDPVVFADLPPEQRAVAERAMDGERHTCDPDPEAFLAFGYRAAEHADDRKRAYLERGGTYYGLSVRLLEHVYAR